MSRENKFILFVLLILVSVFSYVVIRNLQRKPAAGDDAVAGKTNEKAGSSKESETSGSDSSAKAAKSQPKRLDSIEDDTIAQSSSTPQMSVDPFDKVENQSGSEEDMVPTQTASRRTQSQPTFEEEPTLQLEQSEEGAANEFGEATVPSTGRRGANSRRSEIASIEEGSVDEQSTPQELLNDGMEEGQEVIDNQLSQTEEAGPQMEAPAIQDDQFEQTGGTQPDFSPPARRGNRRGRQTEEFAQVPDPVETQEQPMLTNPRTSPPVPMQNVEGHRTGRMSSQDAFVDDDAEKLGGFKVDTEFTNPNAQGHSIPARRRPAASGQFDPTTEPLLNNTGEYVVRPHDNFWRISRKVYGTSRYFAALAKHNEQIITNPKDMKPGRKVLTPPKETLEQNYKSLIPVQAAPQPMGAVFDLPNAPKTSGFFMDQQGQPHYRIGETDTLSGISQKTLGRMNRWDEIYELNRDRLATWDNLTVGTIIRLPPDASQARVVGRPIHNN